MEKDTKITEPDNTAVRVALWRALHVQIDAKPHILEDEVGLKLIAPPDDWRQRPDMHPEGLRRVRASIVARARFIEDLAIEQCKHGINQYIILGAGLDTFAQRHPEVASTLKIFEIDQPGTQAWKKRRLIELNYDIPNYLKFVPVNFEAGSSWWNELLAAGFDKSKPAVVSCTGVTLYLTKKAIVDTLHQIAQLAPGSTLAITFILPMNLIDAEDRPMQEMAKKGARAAGTPFISFFPPEEMLALASEAGFKQAHIVSGNDLTKRYFSGRKDNFAPSNSEQFLVAAT